MRGNSKTNGCYKEQRDLARRKHLGGKAPPPVIRCFPQVDLQHVPAKAFQQFVFFWQLGLWTVKGRQRLALVCIAFCPTGNNLEERKNDNHTPESRVAATGQS